MNTKEFIKELEKINVKLDQNQLKQLEKYYEMLVEYNKIMNLTGITEHDQVFLKHFYDSLTIAKIIDLKEEKSLCDIGTGAGFPGLVLKICFPNKRINFLSDVINELGLKNIEVIHTRAEEYAQKNRNKFDITTARAVAHLSILLEYAIPMTKEGKYFIAMKANVKDEINEIDNALKVLDTKIVEIDEFNLPIENSNRTIIKFKKIKNVGKYPRKYSDIKKKRL